MKKISLVTMVLLAALSFQACNNAAKDSKDTADSLNAVKDSTTDGSTGIAVDKMDAEFATKLANGGLAEVALGKLAESKTTNPQIKEFAGMMVMDHSKANEELIAIAKTKNITLPVAPDEEHQKKLTDLSAKTGKDFDTAYVDAMVDGHKKTVDLLEDASKNCKDSDLMTLATKLLPTVKGHLAKIEAIKASMK
jgi:putative membrane protein